MLPATTSAWLRARFKTEVEDRFRGARESSEAVAAAAAAVGGDEDAGAEQKASTTALRVCFSLPLASYATTLLQHLTGEGLDGPETGAAAPGEEGGGEEGYGDFEGEEEEYGELEEEEEGGGGRGR